MRFRFTALTIALLTVGMAGCLDDSTEDPDAPLTEGTQPDLYSHALTDAVTISWAPGALSSISNTGDADVTVTLPFGWLALRGDADAPGAFTLVGEDGTTVAAGNTVWFLAPPRVEDLTIAVDGLWSGYQLDEQPLVDPEDEVVSGENVWDLEAIQEERFPNREPGHPDGNYQKAIAYFAEYFEDLGMEVEVDPYGTQDLSNENTCVNARGGTICPDSVANVVATLPGTDPSLPTIFVAGGHFDMVSGTTHAAFDDTSGTVATMELARAMSQFEWRHTLKFGLWGGEENGILGSQFWVQTHPEARATVTSYWNLDVVGMSWPAPLVKPDPIVIAAGPDAPGDAEGGATGPVADSLLGFAQELQTDWFGFPDQADNEDMWYYEGIVSGQASGYAQVNAQSDHTPFMGAGIPSWFIFNGDTLAGDNPIGIHNERDTLENMTMYAFFGGEQTDEYLDLYDETGEKYEWAPEDWETAKDALADSWEVVMWFPFYSTVLQDVGYWHAPGVAGQAEANAP